jgi:hypothetical protein
LSGWVAASSVWAISVWTIFAGLVLPGACAVRLLRLGAGPLERLVLAVALGRLLLAGASLAAASLDAFGWMPLWPLAACLAYALVWRFGPRPAEHPAAGRPRASSAPALLAVLLASAVLVGAVVARSGVVRPTGELVFYGADSVTDPLFYSAVTGQLLQRGLPMTMPYASGLPPITGHVVFYAVDAGLRAMGIANALDVVFRVRPLLDVSALGLTAFALVRALGGSGLAAAAGALLLLLGGGISGPVTALLNGVGLEARPLYTWVGTSSFLLAFNSVAPALQACFAALMLLARLGREGGRAAVVAGVLVASVFETKLFLWPPFAAGLVAVALIRPPPPLARPLRLAAGASVLCVLPSLAEKFAFAMRTAGDYVAGFRPCLGCFPRYMWNASVGSGDRSYALFESFAASDWLRPELWLASAGAFLFYAALALGVRWIAAPALWRGGWSQRDSPPGSRAVHRVIAWAAPLGLALAASVGTEPHWLNAGLFSWSAAFGTWPVLGLSIGRWRAEGRTLRIALVVALALSTSLGWIWTQGYRAPPRRGAGPQERELLATLAGGSGAGDVVLEPSFLVDPGWLSPVAWLAERPVYLSFASVAAYLPEEERERRVRVLEAVFAGTDRDAALAAIRASHARFVYAPWMTPLGFAPGDALEPLAGNAAGTVYRVRSAAE